MLYLFALFVLPYLCFVFFGEGLNPFSKPANPAARSQWRHGRAMGLATFLGMILAVAASLAMGTSLLLSLTIGVISSLIFAAAFSARKISVFFWG